MSTGTPRRGWGLACGRWLYAHTVAFVNAPQYSVKLDCSHPSAACERIAAELRFIAALESALGGPDRVAEAYRAWVAASNAKASEIKREAAEMAFRWPSAYQAAAAQGLAGIQWSGTPVFEIQLH